MLNKFYKVATIALMVILVACSISSNNARSDLSAPPTVNQPDLLDTPTVIDPLLPTPLPTVMWTAELENLRTKILGDTCEFPCAFGIDPGSTPASDVPTILEQLKQEGLIEGYSLLTHPVAASYAIVFEGFGGNVAIDESKNIVTSVGFGLSIKFLTLGDVIGTYGEPKLVAYGRGDSFEGLYLAYPAQEMFLWIRTDLFGDQLVTPEMTVITLNYLSAGAPNSELEQPHIVWIDWEGYKEIYYYYRKLEEIR